MQKQASLPRAITIRSFWNEENHHQDRGERGERGERGFKPRNTRNTRNDDIWIIQNHECTRISSIHGIAALIIEIIMLRSWFCRGLRFAPLWRSRHPRPTYCYWARNSGTNFAASSPPATPCPKESQYGGSAAVSERLSKMTNPIRSAVASCGVVPRAFHGMAIS